GRRAARRLPGPGLRRAEVLPPVVLVDPPGRGLLRRARGDGRQQDRSGAPAVEDGPDRGLPVERADRPPGPQKAQPPALAAGARRRARGPARGPARRRPRGRPTAATPRPSGRPGSRPPAPPAGRRGARRRPAARAPGRAPRLARTTAPTGRRDRATAPTRLGTG